MLSEYFLTVLQQKQSADLQPFLVKLSTSIHPVRWGTPFASHDCLWAGICTAMVPFRFRLLTTENVGMCWVRACGFRFTHDAVFVCILCTSFAQLVTSFLLSSRLLLYSPAQQQLILLKGMPLGSWLLILARFGSDHQLQPFNIHVRTQYRIQSSWLRRAGVAQTRLLGCTMYCLMSRYQPMSVLSVHR